MCLQSRHAVVHPLQLPAAWQFVLQPGLLPVGKHLLQNRKRDVSMCQHAWWTCRHCGELQRTIAFRLIWFGFCNVCVTTQRDCRHAEHSKTLYIRVPLHQVSVCSPRQLCMERGMARWKLRTTTASRRAVCVVAPVDVCLAAVKPRSSA